MKFGDGKHIKRLNAYEKEKVDINMTNTVILNNFKAFFEDLKKNYKYSRLGKTFATTNNFYFYDTGTGKVLSVTLSIYKIIECLLETDTFDSIFQLGIANEELYASLQEIKEAVQNENILQAPPVLTMVGPQTHSLKETIYGDLKQITLEITERCNFRCNYCIYSEGYESFREFGNKDMSFDAAQKAIDDLKNRSKNQKIVNIGFYGGEPLLRFPFIKECINYAQEVIKDKELTFTMTSNMSLMTAEIAKYFAGLKNKFVILASIDGPEFIHDKNRKYPNGEGTFNDVIVGLKCAFDAYNSAGKTDLIHLSMVIEKTGDYGKVLSEIKEFIQQTEWIPDNITTNVAHRSVYLQPTEYTGINSQEEKDYFSVGDAYADPILKWAKKENEDLLDRDRLYTSYYEEKIYYRIHDRPIYDKPMQFYPMNGCCVPFAKRTYVTAEGNYLICEKVGETPDIGNVFTGIDIEKVKKYYVDDYINEATKYCGECWAINICNECYLNCYDKNGINFCNRHLPCRANRYLIYQDLIMYHEILESTPEKLQYLNQLEFE